MRLHILPALLIVLEAGFFFYIIARDNNRRFRETVQSMKEKFIEKTKLNFDNSFRDFSKRNYIIFFGVFIVTLFMDNKMVIIILITAFMIILLRLRIPYEKFEEAFINYKPSLKKYNIYLLLLLLIQVVTIILTILFAGWGGDWKNG